MPQYLCSFDMGTTSVKAGIVTTDGHVVGHITASILCSFLGPNGSSNRSMICGRVNVGRRDSCCSRLASVRTRLQALPSPPSVPRSSPSTSMKSL